MSLWSHGIRRHLDYLTWLEVAASWLAPLPMADFAYDITDCTDIEPSFGTLAGARSTSGQPCAPTRAG